MIPTKFSNGQEQRVNAASVVVVDSATDSGWIGRATTLERARKGQREERCDRDASGATSRALAGYVRRRDAFSSARLSRSVAMAVLPRPGPPTRRHRRRT